MRFPGRAVVGRLLIIAGMSWLPGAVSAGIPVGDLLGELQLHVAGADDTLPDLAIDEDLGYGELQAANPGIDPWLVPPGAVIVLPKAHLLPKGPRRGIMVNLGDQRIYSFGRGGTVASYPIGIAVEEQDMRLGATRIERKQERPTWYPPPSVRAESPDLPESVPPGDDNPLGSHALYVDWPRVLIHGTNKPYGVGRRVSHGCIRLYETDIAQLYRDTPVGTPVAFIFEPVKLGWSAGVLYLEIHPTLAQMEAMEEGEPVMRDEPGDLRAAVVAAAGGAIDRVDWDAVAAAAVRRSGLPVAIAR